MQVVGIEQSLFLFSYSFGSTILHRPPLSHMCVSGICRLLLLLLQDCCSSNIPDTNHHPPSSSSSSPAESGKRRLKKQGMKIHWALKIRGTKYFTLSVKIEKFSSSPKMVFSNLFSSLCNIYIWEKHVLSLAFTPPQQQVTHISSPPPPMQTEGRQTRPPPNATLAFPGKIYGHVSLCRRRRDGRSGGGLGGTIFPLKSREGQTQFFSGSRGQFWRWVKTQKVWPRTHKKCTITRPPFFFVLFAISIMQKNLSMTWKGLPRKMF